MHLKIIVLSFLLVSVYGGCQARYLKTDMTDMIRDEQPWSRNHRTMKTENDEMINDGRLKPMSESRWKTNDGEEIYVPSRTIRINKVWHNTDPQLAGNGRQKMNVMSSRRQEMIDNVSNSDEDSVSNKIYKPY